MMHSWRMFHRVRIILYLCLQEHTVRLLQDAYVMHSDAVSCCGSAVCSTVAHCQKRIMVCILILPEHSVLNQLYCSS